MKQLNHYKKEEVNEIMNIFATSNTEAKKQLAKKLNRNYDAVSQKYIYEKNKNGKVSKKVKVKSQKKADISVTHINKSLTSATFELQNGVKMTIHSNKFKINGLEIEC